MLTVHLLGRVEVRDEQGREAADLLRRPKRIALLSYLAAALPRGFHRRDKLIGLFWAEMTQDKARRALNQALFVLRSELGKDLILSRGDNEVALDEARALVDALQFEQRAAAGDAERALQHYRGEFLEGLHVSDAPEFERWLDQERSRYRQEAVKLALALAERYEGEGKFLAAVERCRWARTIAPTDERVTRRLLRLLDGQGDRATALREFEAFAKMLDEDYGLEPSPETLALVDRIRSRDTPASLDTGPSRVASERPAGDGSSGGLDDAFDATTVVDETPASRLTYALSDRYRVERKIDSGGMSLVYLAEDLKHGREVAIKVLRPELAESIAVERFLQEIHFGASLQHPNIVSLHDSGKADGSPYYVMPYFAGGSLRDRLKHERQLPLEDAIQIALEVANALQAAHANGVLHRDVKPANIMLEAGHAVVSDFGIARALTEAGGERLTAHGVALGTPGYMSPEQGSGDEDLDVRSDEYSLACVLYEMLAGEMVFDGPSARAIVAKHQNLSPPPVTTLRTTVPRSVERVILRALEKSPADRYSTVAEFARELKRTWETREEPEPQPSWWNRTGRKLIPAALVTVVLLGAVLVGPRIVRTIWIPTAAPADTTVYAIFPFSYQSGISTRVGEVQLLHDAIGRWSGLDVVDPLRLSEALAARENASVTTAGAQRLAQRFGAGRYIYGSLTRAGDSLRMRAGLYGTQSGDQLAMHAVRIPPDMAGVDALFASLVDSLLFRGAPPEDAPSDAVTRSLPARQVFGRGHRALDVWDLSQADLAFTAATVFDPGYAQAHMWVALVKAWSGAQVGSWNLFAQQAGLGREHMSERDRAITSALLEEASGNLGDACPTWRRFTETAPHDFVGRYGLGRCLTRDAAVYRDPASPSGWSFRTSQHAALKAYQRAFELRPAILVGFKEESYRSLRRLFWVSGHRLRSGLALPPDTNRLVAQPEWRGDSLALTPYPFDDRTSLGDARAGVEAVRNLRLMFRDITLAWLATSPEDGNAMEALALSLSLLGNPSALDTLRRARNIMAQAEDRLRVAGSEVMMELSFSLPWNESEVQAARVLADSLLSDRLANPRLLSGLAALTGRAGLAAAQARDARAAASLAFGDRPELRQTAPALLVFAALGGPTDSLVVLERRVRAAIDNLPLEQRRLERLQWLARSATLAFSTYKFDSLAALASDGDVLLQIQVQLEAGDTVAVREALDAVREDRRGLLPGDVTLDGLLPEAEILVAIGDFENAAAWLDQTLQALNRVVPYDLGSAVTAASLVRAMALRATIAQRLGDDDVARQWARAVVTLWSNADPFLQPLVDRMRQLGG